MGRALGHPADMRDDVFGRNPSEIGEWLVPGHFAYGGRAGHCGYAALRAKADGLNDAVSNMGSQFDDVPADRVLDSNAGGRIRDFAGVAWVLEVVE